MNIQNKEQNTHLNLFQQNFSPNVEQPNKVNKIYDDEFVNLINGLNESIKEYYKVSRNNITEANSFLSFYEEQGKQIQTLMDQINSSNSYERINEVLEQIPKINEIMSQLQMNTNSNEKNLNLFFEDAKILFKRMKMKRKQKIMEMNNYNNNDINKELHDSFTHSFHVNQMKNISKDNLMKNNSNMKRAQSPYSRIKRNNNNNSNQNNNLLLSINNIFTKIMKLLNGFTEFNFIISKMNLEGANKYNNLQNTIKKELNLLMNLVKNLTQSKMLNNNKSYSNIGEDQNSENKRSKSIPSGINLELEKLKKINQINEKKIMDLNNQLNMYKQNLNNMNNYGGLNSEIDNKIRTLELENNNLNLKIMQYEQQIIEKDNIINDYQNSLSNKNINIKNNNLNLNNILKQKDNQISNLQQQLYVYQNNEDLLNSQITDLNKNFQLKINQYDLQINQMSNKISSLSKMVISKNKENLKYQNEIKGNKQEIERLQKVLNTPRLSNSNKNIPQGYEENIQKLKNEINNYKTMINQYENNIRELSQVNNNVINNQNKNMNMNMNLQSNKIIEEQKMKINQLSKEIINYQRKEKANEDNINKYLKQIEEMNNNIINTNTIIEQKDELIKQLNEKKMEQVGDINNNQNNNINSELKKERDDYKFQFDQMQKKYLSLKEILEDKNSNHIQNNNNDMLKIKLMDMQLENERLQKENSELKEVNNNQIVNNNNNNLLLNNQIINGNNIQQNNKEFVEKMKELTLENQRYKESISQTKENITKLESEINKKNEELEGLRTFIFKLQSQIERDDDKKERAKSSKRIDQKRSGSNMNISGDTDLCITEPNRKDRKHRNNVDQNKSFENPKDTEMINKLLNKINEQEKKISNLQNKNKELQYQLEEKQVEKEISGYRTEDVNFSNYEEEFDLKKMVNGARDKNRSEDINIDYPGVQGIKDKYKELLQNMNMLEEQVKILICNINCNSKVKPQITQICQLMRIPPKNIQLIIAGKDKKKALGLIV